MNACMQANEATWHSITTNKDAGQEVRIPPIFQSSGALRMKLDTGI